MNTEDVQDILTVILNGMLAEMQAQTQALHSIATSQQGLWECCLSGRGGNDLLLEISMLHYKLPPDERWKMYQQRLAEQEEKPEGGDV